MLFPLMLLTLVLPSLVLFQDLYTPGLGVYKVESDKFIIYLIILIFHQYFGIQIHFYHWIQTEIQFAHLGMECGGPWLSILVLASLVLASLVLLTLVLLQLVLPRLLLPQLVLAQLMLAPLV